MDPLQALLLALVQGITEFLPISSSAPLILPARILGWPDQGLAFDVAVHLGSLLAVLVALRRDVLAIVGGTLRAGAEGRMNAELRLGLLVILGTLPVIAAGLALKDLVETSLRSVAVIATTTVVFGLLLGWADRREVRAPAAAARTETDLGVRDALLIGLAQCLALVPGTSRSGITMTAGLLLGLSRGACARFSFLLSIPTIAGAAVLALKDLLDAPGAVDWSALGVGFLASAIAAWACIRFFLDLVDRVGFMPFVIYRLVLGTLLFALLL
ncbi:MAG: undecaprenyl-diphosphate phosphatase [Pseudomonadales bacterium]|nr:undecaprenyl-diphosphate phosphatase [Pseudomonadales bacterium]